jgi:hypothetical protein
LHVSSDVSGEGFRFEHTLSLGEREYDALRQLAPTSHRARVIMLGLGALGLVLLVVNRWTAPLGVVLLLVAALFLFTPRIARKGVREEYIRARYLHGPVKYGVDDRGMWFYGGALRAESAWTGLAVWERRDNWLLLGADGMPQVVLPVGELRAAGVYDRVLELARAHAPEFDSPEAHKRPSRPAA